MIEAPDRLRAVIRKFLRKLAPVGLAALFITTAAAAQTIDKTFPQNRPTCHARVYDAAHLAAHPKQRVAAISFERSAREIAAEKVFIANGEMTEEIIAATLRVRLRGDRRSHVVQLECEGARNGARYCEVPACPGGEIGVMPDGARAIRLSLGGKLRNLGFIAHYIRLSEACDGVQPAVLESGDDDHEFLLTAAAAETCK
jgi:hypothetical protein